MLVACRLASLSALGAHYAGINALAQSGVDEHRSYAVLDRLRPCGVPARVQRRHRTARRASVSAKASAIASRRPASGSLREHPHGGTCHCSPLRFDLASRLDARRLLLVVKIKQKPSLSSDNGWSVLRK